MTEASASVGLLLATALVRGLKRDGKDFKGKAASEAEISQQKCSTEIVLPLC